MLRNYLLIGVRNFFRNPIYSFINVVGLSVGIASSLLIMLWVVHELSFDRFHRNADRIGYVLMHGNVFSEIRTWADIPMVAAEEMKQRPDIFERVTVTSGTETHLLTHGERGFQKSGRFVDREYLNVMTFRLIAGNADQVLDNPQGVVLTESTARALFGDGSALGKTVLLDQKVSMIVTGVLEDFPENSSYRYDFLASLGLYGQVVSWLNDCINDPDCAGFRAFVRLKEGVTMEEATNAIKDRVLAHTTWMEPRLEVYPLLRRNLHGEFINGKESSKDYEDYVTGFSILAIGILVVACINFMNLSTARSERRAREVGIRKVAGSQRGQLITQFLGESLMVTTLAFGLALLIAQILLPTYNILLEKNLRVPYDSPYFWFATLAIILVTGIFSGSYPAWFLSGFRPVQVLKGQILVGRGPFSPGEFSSWCNSASPFS